MRPLACMNASIYSISIFRVYYFVFRSPPKRSSNAVTIPHYY